MAGSSAQASIADRLSSTLFVAALAHGIVILGITFTTSPLPETAALAPINVTLLVDSDKPEKAPDRADLLAERNQTGAGKLEQGDRPTRALSADHPVSQIGDPFGADLTDGTPREQSQAPEQLAARSADPDASSSPETTAQSAELPMKAANLIRDVAPQTLATEVDLRTVLPSNDSDSDVASPNTSESVIATYLVGWRQRVERIGTANFPERLLGRKELGRPTLEVAIGADGNIEDIVVRKSSGDSTLDQAALKILRMAAPFEPLPPGITSKYKVLRFAYEWDFSVDGKG